MIGLVGRKVGMTRIFNEDGVSVPVTVIEIEANRVTQVKTLENDGYTAVQVTTGSKKANRVTKPEAGHFVKAGVKMLHTVTLYHIVYLVLLVKTKLQVVCLKVKKWQDI